ncbi:MAG: 4'-phosphopantetheinyl transferase superfamily protein [Chitinophagales bacterium]|nr:4'-phosphopantetheinyl transferase superfamily protein [Chitinophagales bacterium]
MPIIREIQCNNFKLLVWKIEEEQEFFLDKLVLSSIEKLEFNSIKPVNRRLEWLATRYVQRILVSDTIYKDDFGKPFLSKMPGHLSLSHCSGFAAVIYGNEAVGIDVEIVHPKVERIASKFLSKKELAFIDQQFSTKHLTLCWSIKESVYKYYGRKNLAFIEGMHIHAFALEDSEVKVQLLTSNSKEVVKINIECIENMVLSYLSA